ncbi:MAG: MarR family winged helix-turn-helix transcriptional regulator, partial [Pseudomonadota bacterium]
DGRRVIVKLTAKGLQLAKKAFKIVTENENRLLAGYAGSDQKELESLLNRLARHLGVKISPS